MAQLGSPVVGLIENHPGKIKFLSKVLPGVRICVDYYSHEYDNWPVWSVDWVGGGPPCVWCSSAGKQELSDWRSEMFRLGAARLAERFSALVADVEQPLESATLNGGMSRTPKGELAVHSNARDGGGAVRVRAGFHYELYDMIATLGEAEPLSVSIRPPLTVRHVLMPMACLDARTFVKGKFTRYRRF